MMKTLNDENIPDWGKRITAFLNKRKCLQYRGSSCNRHPQDAKKASVTEAGC